MSGITHISDHRSVIFFSGHPIDTRDCGSPRFPPENESIAASAIAGALDEFGVSPNDLGLTQGACGADLLFAEALLKRGARLELRLPTDEETFIRDSVAFEKPPSATPDRWRERFLAVRNHPSVKVRHMPRDLIQIPNPDELYERCNLWILQEALGFGARKVRFVCLWNGEIGVRLGDTYHLIREVRRHGGKVRWIDTSKLWRLPSAVKLTLPEASY